jgi:hypothetical protein
LKEKKWYDEGERSGTGVRKESSERMGRGEKNKEERGMKDPGSETKEQRRLKEYRGMKD